MQPFQAKVNLGVMAMKGCLHSPKPQHYWNLTIRLFSVISWTLVVGVLLLWREAVSVFYSPSQLGHIFIESTVTIYMGEERKESLFCNSCSYVIYFSWSPIYAGLKLVMSTRLFLNHQNQNNSQTMTRKKIIRTEGIVLQPRKKKYYELYWIYQRQ